MFTDMKKEAVSWLTAPGENKKGGKGVAGWGKW
jgi:hypothetical protein